MEEDGVVFERFVKRKSLDCIASLEQAVEFEEGTILVRFRTLENANNQALVSFSNSRLPFTHFTLGVAKNGKISLSHLDHRQKGLRDHVGFGFHDGNWHTAALVVDGRGTRLYVDGVLLYFNRKQRLFIKDVLAANCFRVGVLEIGGKAGGAETWHFDGDIDMLEIYDHALPEATIKKRSAQDPPGRRRFNRGFEIPFLDLAKVKDGYGVVDRVPKTYLGPATTVALPGTRTVIAIYREGEQGGPLRLKRSADFGRTWSKRLPVPADWVTRDVPVLHWMGDRAMLFAAEPGQPGGFKTAAIIPRGPQGAQLVSMPFRLHHPQIGGAQTAGASLLPLPRAAGAGTPQSWRMFFHDDRGMNWRSDGVVGPDGWDRWTPPQMVLPAKFGDKGVAKRGPFLCEPCAVVAPDGRLTVFLFRAENRLTESMIGYSRDFGGRITDPFELPASLTGDRHVARVDPVSGRLVIVFRDHSLTAYTPDSGDWVAWVGTFEDLKRGRSGQYRVRLLNNMEGSRDCGYSGLEVCTDRNSPDFGMFLATSHGKWRPSEPPYIACRRFKLADLDRRVAQQKQ